MASLFLNEIDIRLPGMRVNALTGGCEDAPPLIALHGWLDNAASFIPLAPYLIKDYRIIALDLPGHGLSEHRPQGVAYHFVDSVPLVLSVADALGLERFAIMGHSMGAGIATLIAGTVRERITSAVFLEGLGPMTSPTMQAPDNLMKHISQQRHLKEKKMRCYPSVENVCELLQSATGISKEAGMLLLHRGLEKRDDGFYWRSDIRLRQRSALRLSEEHVHAFVENIECPSILVTATEGFPFDREAMAERIRRLAGLRTVSIEGNHHVHMDKPKEIAEFVLPLLGGR